MVEKGDQIEYKVLKQEPIIEPDNPNYEWEGDEPKTAEERIDKWFQMVKDRFESFEHHEESSLFRSYRDYHDNEESKTMSLPTGKSGFEHGNPMADDLMDALSYRIHSFGKDSNNSWKIFDKLCGDYELTIVDNNVLIERQKIMARWLKWINESPELTAIDPLTNEVAVGLPDNNGQILYYFPKGVNDTYRLHYKVFEEVKGAMVLEDIYYTHITDAAVYFALEQLKTHGDIKNPMSLMRPMMQIPIFKGQHEIIKPRLEEAVEIATEMFESGDEGSHYETIVDEIKRKVPEHGEATLEEKTKELAPRQLLNRVTDEPLLVKLQANRPPASEKDKGGKWWPRYKGGKFLLRFTNESFDVLTKATGRKWGWPSESCETWNGCAGRGPCSDIKYGNCIIWLFEMSDDKEYPQDYNQNVHDEMGRIMIRWGDGFDKNHSPIGVKVGIEPGAYPKRAAWTKNMIKAIGLILTDAGMFDYHSCVTPYTYKGYSDYARGQNEQIDYRGLRYRGPDGTSYDLTLDDVDLYLLLAHDPLLNKFQASDVLQLGSEPSKMALAQNQAIWAMPDKVRWLIRWGEQTGNVEEVINFLLQHEVIQPDLVATWTENLPAYAPNYQNPEIMDNIVYTIMSHPMLTDDLQRNLRANHDGFIRDGEFIGTFDEIMYLKLNRIHLFENDYHIPLVKAPTDVLDSIVEMVLANDFSKSDIRGVVQKSNIEQDIRYSPSEVREIFFDNYDYLASIYALISAPNLSATNHTRIIQSFTAWYNDNWKGKEGDENNQFINKQIQKVVRAIQSTIAYPLQEQTDWGYHRNPLPIKYNEWPKEWRLQIESKQNLYSVMAALVLTPNDEQFIELLMTNIKSREVYQYLWRYRQRYNINPIKFTMDMNNRNTEKNTPIKNKWVTSKIFMKAIEESDDRNLSLLKYSYYSDELTVNRASVPYGVVKRILTKLPKLINRIGIELFATWLSESEDFFMFENYVFQTALGDRFVKKTRDFMDYKSPETPAEWNEWMLFTNNLTQLQLAACGGDLGVDGLSTNVSITEGQQLKLILEPDDERLGGSKWRAVSKKYGGAYEDYLGKVIKNLIKNPNVAEATLSWILNHYPEYTDDILSNPNAPSAAIADLISSDPLKALTNEGLDSQTLQYVITYIFENLLKNPPIDASRFKDYIYEGMDDYIHTYMRDSTTPLLSGWLSEYRHRLNDRDWLRFWRGGTYKRAMELPPSQNEAPENPETERPMALVDEPIIINKPHIIYTLDVVSVNEGSDYEITHFNTRYIEEINVLDDGRIHVKGRRRPAQRYRNFEETYQNVAEMYGWIPPEDRTNESIKWNHSIVLITTDERDFESIDALPEWRLTIEHRDISQIIQITMQHPSITEEIIIEMCHLYLEYNDFRVRASNGSHILSLNGLFCSIGEEDEWTPKIIKEFSDVLLPAESRYKIRQYANVKPTNLMRDIAMGIDTKLLEQYGYDDSYELRNFRGWVLRQFKDTLPIEFIYMMLSDLDISEDIRNEAMRIRDSRIREFLEYLQRLSENEEVEEMVMESEVA